MTNRSKRVKQQRKRNKVQRPISQKDSPLVVPYKVRQHFDAYYSAMGNIPSGSLASLVTYGTNQFRLSDVTNFTKFTVLYDQFMIKKVELMYLPIQRDSVIQYTEDTKLTETMFTGPSYMHVVTDFDDFTAPTTINEVVSRPNSVTLDLARPAHFSLVPRSTIKTNDLVSNLATIVPKSSQWIDCSNANVDHLGIKWAWEIPLHNQSNLDYPIEQSINVLVTYHFAFRYPRL